MGDTQLPRLEGGGCETDAEALLAASATLWLLFKPPDLGEPSCVVVVAIYPTDAKRFGMPLAFVLADVVFFKRKDVGVEIEDGGTNVVLEHPLNNGGGARRTASVKEHFVEACGNENVTFLFHALLFL